MGAGPAVGVLWVIYIGLGAPDQSVGRPSFSQGACLLECFLTGLEETLKIISESFWILQEQDWLDTHVVTYQHLSCKVVIKKNDNDIPCVHRIYCFTECLPYVTLRISVCSIFTGGRNKVESSPRPHSSKVVKPGTLGSLMPGWPTMPWCLSPGVNSEKSLHSHPSWGYRAQTIQKH